MSTRDGKARLKLVLFARKYLASAPATEQDEGAKEETKEQPKTSPKQKKRAATKASVSTTTTAALNKKSKGETAGASPKKLTLVLDLDDTLISTVDYNVSSYESVKDSLEKDKKVEMYAIQVERRVYVITVRPGVKAFLEWASARYELFLFTTAVDVYVDQVLARIDPGRRFFPRGRTLTKADCGTVTDFNAKDLTKVSKDLSRVVLVDNGANCFLLQPRNGIPIMDYTWNNPDDDALEVLREFLETKVEPAPDVRPVLHAAFHLENRIEDIAHAKLAEARRDAFDRMF